MVDGEPREAEKLRLYNPASSVIAQLRSAMCGWLDASRGETA